MSSAAISARTHGRLTEHRIHVDLTGAPEVEHTTNGRTGSFVPDQIIIGYQYSWTGTHMWHPLFVAVTAGAPPQETRHIYTDPGQAPRWVQDLVAQFTPTLGLVA